LPLLPEFAQLVVVEPELPELPELPEELPELPELPDELPELPEFPEFPEFPEWPGARTWWNSTPHGGGMHMGGAPLTVTAITCTCCPARKAGITRFRPAGILRGSTAILAANMRACRMAGVTEASFHAPGPAPQPALTATS
jgi:hypothetical protein